VSKNLPEFTIADDIADHWHAEKHHSERVDFVTRLRNIASAKKCRITVVSGDVHVGCVATVNSNTDNKRDNSSMINNLITSAIGTVVPPAALLAYLDLTKSCLDKFKDGMEGSLHKFEDSTVHMKSRNFMVRMRYGALNHDLERRSDLPFFFHADARYARKQGTTRVLVSGE
jgi:hypothetical protein